MRRLLRGALAQPFRDEVKRLPVLQTLTERRLCRIGGLPQPGFVVAQRLAMGKCRACVGGQWLWPSRQLECGGVLDRATAVMLDDLGLPPLQCRRRCRECDAPTIERMALQPRQQVDGPPHQAAAPSLRASAAARPANACSPVLCSSASCSSSRSSAGWTAMARSSAASPPAL
jgi:hypothetical protein